MYSILEDGRKPRPVNGASAWFTRAVEAVDTFAARPVHPAALVFLLALVLRAAIAAWLPAEVVWVDGHRYVQVARNLLDGEGFGGIYDNRLSVPTQAILIAAVQLLFGENYLALRIVCAVIGSGTCLLGFFLARRLFGATAALLAGLVLAVYPFHVYVSALFEYPQTLFMFMMTAFFVLLYRFLDSGRNLVLFAASLCLGIAVLTVPTVLPFVPLLVLFVGYGSFRKLLVRGLIVSAAILLTLGSWTTRNYLAYGQFILINKSAGLSFWGANNETYYLYGKESVVPPCPPKFEATSFCKEYIDSAVELGAKGLTELEMVEAHEKTGWDHGMRFIRESPGKFMELVISKFLHFWSPIPDAVQASDANAGDDRKWLAIASYTPVLLLGLAGVYVAARRWRELLPIYLYVIAFTAPYCVFLPTTRYRLPLDLFLILFAGLAVERLMHRRATPPMREQGVQ